MIHLLNLLYSSFLWKYSFESKIVFKWLIEYCNSFLVKDVPCAHMAINLLHVFYIYISFILFTAADLFLIKKKSILNYCTILITLYTSINTFYLPVVGI